MSAGSLRAPALAAFLSLCFASSEAWADLSVEQTMPRNGATVAAGVTELHVRFSREMKDRSWTWLKEDEPGAEFPQVEGTPSFLSDGRTCVLRVRLQPGTRYVLWLNDPYERSQLQDFRSTDGTPLRAYRWEFKTAPEITASLGNNTWPVLAEIDQFGSQYDNQALRMEANRNANGSPSSKQQSAIERLKRLTEKLKDPELRAVITGMVGEVVDGLTDLVSELPILDKIKAMTGGGLLDKVPFLDKIGGSDDDEEKEP